MKERFKTNNYHSNTKKNGMYSAKSNWKWVFVLLIIIVFLFAIMADSKTKEIELKETNDETNYVTKNFEGIITIIDDEGNDSFSTVWGQLIKEGYPICSNLVPSYVGKDDYMDWETIEALNDVGVEFVFHSSSHASYNNMTKDEIISDFEYGKSIMEEHNLDNRYIVWIGSTSPSVIEIGNHYFDAGFAISNSNIHYDQIEGQKPIIYYYKQQTYSYPELQNYIDYAIKNNEWIVLFTRSSYDFMNEDQISIFKKAFEYATNHNVGIVTASEGFDLYYNNKLGNN